MHDAYFWGHGARDCALPIWRALHLSISNPNSL